MKRVLKLYWPMLISILLFILYGLLVGTIFYSDALFSNDVVGIFLVLFTLLLVVSVYGEMIYFIVKAANDKKLKHKVLWCFIVYFFNVFIIPYFNLKYVCKDKKVKLKMFVFGLISVISLIFGIFIPSFGFSPNDGPLFIVDEESLVSFKFPSSYHETSVGEYDIYVKDHRRGINFGIFVYSSGHGENVDDIMQSRDLLIRSRDEVFLLEENVEEMDDRKITTRIYSGLYDGVRNIYFVSSVEFVETDVFVNSIGVYLYEDYLNYKSEFRKILLDMEYIGAKQTA